MPGAFVWSSVATGDAVRVLPDGCMDLLWDGIEIVIAGPDTHAHLFERPAGSPMTGLRFAPGHAPRVLGVPADAFTNERVAARRGVVTGARPCHHGSPRRVAGARRRPRGRRARRVDRGATPTPRSSSTSRRSRARAATARRSRTRVGLSTRQLQRRSAAAFGYGAKTLGRVLRMQHALALARRGVRAADAAARTGYADQSHLARDVKDMAGVPLGALDQLTGSGANSSTWLPSGSSTIA